MIYLKEVTKWNCPNHTYIFKDRKSAKIIGYIKQGDNFEIMLDKAMKFDKRYRKFEEVKR